jgi:hypothetical protein
MGGSQKVGEMESPKGKIKIGFRITPYGNGLRPILVLCLAKVFGKVVQGLFPIGLRGKRFSLFFSKSRNNESVRTVQALNKG